jgi:hypothetical protein
MLPFKPIEQGKFLVNERFKRKTSCATLSLQNKSAEKSAARGSKRAVL